MVNIERPWRLTRASVQKVAQAFNLSQRAYEELRAQSMRIPGSTKDPKTLPVRMNTVERCESSYSALEYGEFCVRVILELPPGFYLAVTLSLPMEFAPVSSTGAPSAVLRMLNSLVLDVDNLTDDERTDAATKMESAKQKLSIKNVINIDVADSGRAYQLLHQLTAIGLTRGFDNTVCYIPRSIALRCDAAYLRTLGNVEVYETEEPLGNAYKGATLEQAIVLECFADGENAKIVKAIDQLVSILSTASLSSDGIVYRITLREDLSNA